MDLKKKTPSKGRTIVDPGDWGKSEVSDVAEAKMCTQSSTGSRGSARVTSMRSSLFKKAASATKSQTETGDFSEKIFGSKADVLGIEVPLHFLDEKSLKFCDYGKNTNGVWTKDIFALVHNGIRCELMDLGTCLKAMKNIGLSLTSKDCADLERWWQVFAEILADFLALDENVLEPWIFSAVSAEEGQLSSGDNLMSWCCSYRKEMREQLSNISKLLRSISENATTTSSVIFDQRREWFIGAFTSMADLGRTVADYLEKEETMFAVILADHYASEKIEREAILDAIFQYMMSDKAIRLSEFLVLQTRWMADPRDQKAHTKYMLSAKNWPLSKFIAQYEMLHTGIVAVFKVKGCL